MNKKSKKSYLGNSHLRFATTVMVVTSLASSVCSGAYRHIVRDRETLAWPHAYTYYRFVIKQVAGSPTWVSDNTSGTAKWLRLSEIALYDTTGNRINLNLTPCATDMSLSDMPLGSCKKTGRLGTESDSLLDVLGYLFDGNTSTEVSKWINANPADTHAWTWGYVYMRLASDATPVAAYNLAHNKDNYDNMPASWALEGSDDGTTWISLDSVSEDATILPEIGVDTWYNGGAAIKISDASAHFFVERGGILSVIASTVPESIRSEGGIISIAQSATLGFDVTVGESVKYIGGGLVGSGSFEKTGGGTIDVSGINSGFAGTVKATDGTLAFHPLHSTPKYTYYRLVVKNRAASNLSIAELALYDIAGERINFNLVQASEPEWSSTNLLPGTYSKFGNGTTDAMSTSARNLFDADLSTDVNGWMQNSNGEYYWIYFTMRLSEDCDVAPASYNLAFTSLTDRAPKSWALQGSDDHTIWFTLDERDAASVAAIAPEGSGWCNGGTPLPLVYESDNAPLGECDAKWFRFSVRAVGGTDGTRAISELSLYDMQGKRLNIGLSSMGINYSVAALPAGSFTWKYQWNGTYNAADQHEDKLFDENMETRLQGWSFGNTPNPATPATWIVWTMRLPNDAAPVAAYNFAPYRSPIDYPASCPADWLVEASRDGVTWFEVDARSGESASSLLPLTAKTYCNNGHPIGFTTGCDSWLAPTGAVIEVSNGAVIELPSSGANTVAGLAIDLTAANNAGSIINFHPAVSGTLYLTCATLKPHLEDAALPVLFSGIVNGANVAGWSVVLNGMPTEPKNWKLRIDENGILRVTRQKKGLVVLFK